jgi:hypothetical protein
MVGPGVAGLLQLYFICQTILAAAVITIHFLIQRGWHRISALTDLTVVVQSIGEMTDDVKRKEKHEVKTDDFGNVTEEKHEVEEED